MYYDMDKWNIKRFSIFKSTRVVVIGLILMSCWSVYRLKFAKAGLNLSLFIFFFSFEKGLVKFLVDKKE